MTRADARMKWFLHNWDQVARRAVQHIVICGDLARDRLRVSLVVGICAARHERVYPLVASRVSGLLYTIPTLAFLALLIPLVGLGRANAIICMVAFSLMILIRNVATGIREVPARRRRRGARAWA